MGIMRKAASISTLGIVNFRNDQERTARYTKQTRNAARLQAAQNARMVELERQQIAALNYANVREGARAANAGWFIDPWDHQAIPMVRRIPVDRVYTPPESELATAAGGH